MLVLWPLRCFHGLAFATIAVMSETVHRENLESTNFNRITVRAGELENHGMCTSGAVIISEDGVDRATASIVGYQQAYPPRGQPLTFILQGGPWAPASSNNTLSFGSEFALLLDDTDRTAPNGLQRFTLTDHTLFPYISDTLSIDQIDTGLGHVLPGTDPEWPYDMERSVTINAAIIKWYANEYGYHDSPLCGVASSFGVNTLMGVVPQLTDAGLTVPGLIAISGAYDDRFRNHDGATDPMRFLPGLTAMALAAQFHGKANPGCTPYELYDEVEAFALGPYATALQEDDPTTWLRKKGLLSQFIGYTGMPSALVHKHRGRIPFDVFREQLLVDQGKVLSAIDTRIAVPGPTSVEFDPASDIWRRKIMEEFLAGPYASLLGHVSMLRMADYQGTIKARPRMKFAGIWEEQRAHKAMGHLLDRLPGIRIDDYNGFYDGIRPAPGSHIFWTELAERRKNRAPLNVSRRVQRDLCNDGRFFDGSSVNTFTLPMGHQLTLPDTCHDMTRQAMCVFIKRAIRPPRPSFVFDGTRSPGGSSELA